MKKKLANLLFMVTVALQATAQITILSMDDVKKSEPIDELVFRAQYELKMVGGYYQDRLSAQFGNDDVGSGKEMFAIL